MTVQRQIGRLAPFRPEHARKIAAWARGGDELRWLAPSTDPPLTPAKVLRWPRPGGHAYSYYAPSAEPTDPGGPLLGYAELNPMRTDPCAWWIGHFVVHPDHRRCGVGRAMLRSLAAEAFERFSAASLCLVVFPDNAAAIRCYESAGFVYAGEELHRFGRKRARHRLLRYAITADRWAVRDGDLAAPSPQHRPPVPIRTDRHSQPA